MLAIDLGTSRVKAGVVDASLRVRSSASATYPTIATTTGMAEQRCDEWLASMRTSVERTIRDAGVNVEAVVLTAQMPTLVAITRSGDVLGHAVTWQDARADELVTAMFDERTRRRISEISGAPIDGRYLIPMHLRRTREERAATATILSAKDYLYFALTARLVTDPSTASGYGNYALATRTWSDELSNVWGVDTDALPEVVDPSFAAPLSESGATLLPGVRSGTPVFVGAADSVCAHHFVSSRVGESISIIDGSSTAILADATRATPTQPILITPLVTPERQALEMDLLATGSSLAWLARLFAVTNEQFEALAASRRSPLDDLRFFPYLAGGEQGALWRSDLHGALTGISLATTRADFALALFEGIAFETLRCLRVLEPSTDATRIVSLTGANSLHLGATLVQALVDQPVIALAHQSPSMLGATLIALDALGEPRDDKPITFASFERLDLGAQTALRARAEAYLALDVTVHDTPRKIT